MESEDTRCSRLPRLLRIELTRDTSIVHFIFYLLASLLTIALFVFINSTQPFVLSLLLNVPPSEQGNTNGSLIFYDQILSIALMGTWGALSDLVGRRVVFVSGFLIMGLAIVLFPLANTVYPELLLLRLFFAIGAAASSTMITAVLADYVGEKSKGKVSGAVGLTSGLGAICGVFVLFALPSYLVQWTGDLAASLKLAYYIVGTGSIIMALILSVTLKPRRTDVLTLEFWRTHLPIFFKRSNSDTAAPVNSFEALEPDSVQVVPHPISPGLEATTCPYLQQQARKHSLDGVNEESSLLKSPVKSIPDEITAANETSKNAPTGCVMPGVLEQTPDAKRLGFWRLVWTGIQLGLRNPFIMLAYLGGFVARGDSVIITLFLPLWVNAYYTDNQLCEEKQSSTPLADETSIRCNNAYRIAYMYSGIAQICALIGAPLFGFLSSRFKHGKAAPLLFASIISAIGYTSLFFVAPSQKSIMLPLMCLIGFGEIGMIVTSLCLITSNRLVSADVRGSVSGTYSLMGVIGTMVSTKVGGLLFDAWSHSAPFLVMGILSCVTLLWSIGVFGYERWRHRRTE